MEIEKIKRVNIGDQVYEKLQKMIFDGNWKSGDKLPSENVLAESFGVSRMTIRQELQKLVAIGLVETRIGEGSYVKELSFATSYVNGMIPALYLSDRSVLDAMEFRIMTEVETAGIAAEIATEEDVDHLKKCYEKMMNNIDNIEEYVNLDFHFHRLICSIAGNSIVIQVHYLLRNVLQDVILNLTKKIGPSNGIEYHALIIRAIEQKDGEAARKYMKEHLMKTIELYQLE
jgi:GntR family transcriptional repressor for pyruvate dehydrogenase complex